MSSDSIRPLVLGLASHHAAVPPPSGLYQHHSESDGGSEAARPRSDTVEMSDSSLGSGALRDASSSNIAAVFQLRPALDSEKEDGLEPQVTASSIDDSKAAGALAVAISREEAEEEGVTVHFGIGLGKEEALVDAASKEGWLGLSRGPSSSSSTTAHEEADNTKRKDGGATSEKQPSAVANGWVSGGKTAATFDGPVPLPSLPSASPPKARSEAEKHQPAIKRRRTDEPSE
jgi:hypothetical protein